MSVRKGASADAEWRAIVRAHAPDGVDYVELACLMGEYASIEIPGFGGVLSGAIDEGKRWLEVTISFPQRGLPENEASAYALSVVGRVLSRFGLTVGRVEMEAA